mgnify:CR=1 FL=1
MTKKATKSVIKKSNILRRFNSKQAYSQSFTVKGVTIQVKFVYDATTKNDFCMYDDDKLIKRLGLQKAAKAEKELDKKITSYLGVKSLIEVKK